MKKNIKYFMMAAVALLSMSACNNEMDEQDPANNGKLQPVQFQMSFASTRTTTGDETAGRATTWKAGDAIGIFAYPAGSTTNAVATNFKYILGKDGNWTATGSEIYPDQALDYYAYYPYQDGVTDPAAINVAALTDQSKTDESSYAASDILASKTSNVAAGNGKVTLAFSHMFAMVEVKVQGDLITQKPTKVELLGVKLNAELNLTATPPAATQKADATAQDVTMFCLENPNADSKVYSFRAAVPAQEIAASTPLVRIYAPDAASKTYTMQHTAAVSYNAGQFRQMIVNIGSKRVALIIPASDTSINPWTPSDAINGDGSEVIPQLITPLTPSTNLKIFYNTKPKDDETLSTNTWFAVFSGKNEAEATPYGNVTLTTDASVLAPSNNITPESQAAYKLTFHPNKEKGNSWYISTGGHFLKSKLDITKKYNLSMKIKVDDSTYGVAVTLRTADCLSSFIIPNATTSSEGAMQTHKVPAAKVNQWVEVNTIFDMSRKSSTMSGTVTDGTSTTSEDANTVDLRIYYNIGKLKTDATETEGLFKTAYVTDIKLEEYVQP